MINENTKRGNLISRVMLGDDSYKFSNSFDLARKIIKTDSTISQTDKVRKEEAEEEDKETQGKRKGKKKLNLRKLDNME